MCFSMNKDKTILTEITKRRLNRPDLTIYDVKKSLKFHIKGTTTTNLREKSNYEEIFHQHTKRCRVTCVTHQKLFIFKISSKQATMLHSNSENNLR